MAKKKKKKQRSPEVDPNEQRRQRLEARRIAKAEAMAAKRKQQLRERIVRWIVIAALAVFAVWFLFLRGQAPDEIAGQTVEHYSLSGAGDHVETAVQYETNPPVSGPHSQRALPCGSHGQPLPDENIVHNLEHGAIGVFYQPTVEPDTVEEVEALVQSYDSHVFSAPDPDMLKPFAITAWGHMMRLDEYNEAAVKGFIEEFRQGGDAPESYQECPNTVTESAVAPPTPTPTGRQAQEASPSPSG